MINVKVCLIAAGGAFLLSVFAGLIGGAGFLAILLRALIFAALAFAFAAGAGILINRFLPELFDPSLSEDESAAGLAEESSEEMPRLGGNVDVSVGGDEEEAPLYGSPVEEEAEEPMPAPSGLDQGAEDGYTEARPVPVSSAAAARPPDLIGDVDVLPDLEGLSDSFVSPITVEDTGSRGETRRSPATAAPQGAGGQFDAKEMAMAIQTILKRDQKG